VAEGAFRGRLPIGTRQGLFRIRPVEDSRAFPEIGLYRQEDELTQYGVNDQLLRQVAAYTGGRYNPSASQVFDAGGRSIESTVRWWPGLLAVALLLNLVELVLRKWPGVLQGWRKA
jgi:Ca-activated chloride channel homolog